MFLRNVICERPITIEHYSPPFTTVAWFFTSSNEDQKVVGTGDYILGTWEYMPYFESYVSGSRKYTVLHKVRKNRMVYIAVHDGREIKMYADGFLVLEDTGPAGRTKAILCAFDIYNNLPLRGVIHVFEHYNKAFSSLQVLQKVYQLTRRPPDALLDAIKVASGILCDKCYYDYPTPAEDEYICVGECSAEGYYSSVVDTPFGKITIMSRLSKSKVDVVLFGDKVVVRGITEYVI